MRGSYPLSPVRGGRALKGEKGLFSLGSLDGTFRGGGFAFMSSMEDWISDIKLSKLEVSDGFLPDLDDSDLGGLVRELAMLTWLAWLGRRSSWLLLSDVVLDDDSEGVWYGFPIPNSSARLIVGTTGVFGRRRPVRGGGARGVSGPLLGLLGLSIGAGPSGRKVAEDGGAEGVRCGGTKLSLGRGKVSARFGVGGASVLEPKPPYPPVRGVFPSLTPPRPAADGLRPESSGAGEMAFIGLGAGFAGKDESSYPASNPPYPPGLLGCAGGGELFAIVGVK